MKLPDAFGLPRNCWQSFARDKAANGCECFWRGAEDDVSDILSYYGEDSPEAIEFSESLENAMQHLKLYPATITRRRDLTRLNVYFWLFYSHWLILKRRPDHLLIVGVHHCARKLAPLLRANVERTHD